MQRPITPSSSLATYSERSLLGRDQKILSTAVHRSKIIQVAGVTGTTPTLFLAQDTIEFMVDRTAMQLRWDSSGYS